MEIIVSAFSYFKINYFNNYPKREIIFYFPKYGYIYYTPRNKFGFNVTKSHNYLSPRKFFFYNIIIKKLQFGYYFRNVIKNIKVILKNILIFFVGENINNINSAPFKNDLDGNKTNLKRKILILLNIKFIRFLQFLVINFFFGL